MADYSFFEVVQAKRRMCETYNAEACDDCPLANGDCGILNLKCTSDSDVKRFENTVMAWASEHPEPVYPSWKHYLIDVGVIPNDAVPPDYVSELIAACVEKPIPADIAQKLGLEPKEAKDGTD